MYIVTEIVLSY